MYFTEYHYNDVLREKCIMNIFKLYPSANEYYPISTSEVEERTEKRPPYYITEKGKSRQLGICPACDNPIQFIGLYKELANTDKPYGKHYGKDAPGLAKHNQSRYYYCPYSAKHTQYDRNSRYNDVDEVALKIVKLLVNNFGQIIYLVEKITGISISPQLAEKMLENYFRESAYLYPGATLVNVPFIFMYFSGTHNLYKRKINNESLRNILCKENDIFFDKNLTLTHKGKNYIDITFCFRNHSKR